MLTFERMIVDTVAIVRVRQLAVFRNHPKFKEQFLECFNHAKYKASFEEKEVQEELGRQQRGAEVKSKAKARRKYHQKPDNKIHSTFHGDQLAGLITDNRKVIR